jgi:hypothetical protein
MSSVTITITLIVQATNHNTTAIDLVSRGVIYNCKMFILQAAGLTNFSHAMQPILTLGR